MKLNPINALGRATTALVSDHDVTDVLAALLGDVQDTLDAAAVGTLVRTSAGEVEVLASTSHRAHDLELWQAQDRQGPCIDAMESGTAVAEGEAGIPGRWPALAPMLERAGYHAVQAHPLRWHGQVLGAMNVFHHKTAVTADEMTLGQAFADIVTLVLLTPNHLDARAITDLTEDALRGRTIIEQAKGVIAHQNGVPVDDAYSLLLQLARSQDGSLTDTARSVVDRAWQDMPDTAQD